MTKKTSDLHNKDILVKLDHVLATAKLTQGKWAGSRFERIRLLQVDSRGDVGERLIESCMSCIGKTSTRSSVANRDQKDWDLFVVDDKIKLEVKTASLGAGARPSFQHEGLDKNRKFDGLVLVDIAPNALYVQFHAHHEIPWKKLHRRRDSVFYKWDFTLKQSAPYEITSLYQFATSYEKMLASILAYRSKQKPEKDR